MTAAKRAKIIMDCLLGSLAFVALFFSVDGSAVAARSPSECPIEQGTFLWYTFVALLSVTLNFLPRSLESHLAWRSFVQEDTTHRRWQLWRRHCKDSGFWVLSVALSLLHLLVIMAFLANLAEADEYKWMFTCAVVILRLQRDLFLAVWPRKQMKGKIVIVPLIACLLSSLGTELAMCGADSIDVPRSTSESGGGSQLDFKDQSLIFPMYSHAVGSAWQA
ncbi:SYT4 [Symbiodinium sp. CCMP2456]|nr:SYT4 [Symbiodinium sp. CCMP2456]